MEHKLDFTPLIKSSYYQTLFGTALDFERDLTSKTHIIQLENDDKTTVEISTPKGWELEDGIVLLVHGLCGSHKSHYMKRLARRFYKKGIKVGRINLRNCGSARGLAKGIYHSGCSYDVLAALKYVKRLFPEAPIVLMGFSLGANISLKLAGELKETGHDLLKGVVAVGPPVDLLSSARLLMEPKNQLYANYFLKMLLDDIYFLHNHFNDLPPINFPKDLTLLDLDEIYIAPRINFTSALEYYYYCSSKRVICDITLPTRILLAKDDPIISSTALDDMQLPKNINLFKTEYGGHIGFVGLNIFKEFRWMDNLVISWGEEMLNL